MVTQITRCYRYFCNTKLSAIPGFILPKLFTIRYTSKNSAEKGVNLNVFLTFLNPGSSTVLPAKSDSDFIFCLQKYKGLIIDRSLVY